MKETHFAIVFALCAFLAVVTARNYVYPLGIDSNTALSACSRRCVIGPGYWCQNITNSGCCKATSYCISHQWSKLKVPEDHDSVCDICKNMVKQARDQLESNQTQEELKEVFEGSCALIHIKPIVRECDKLVDEFIPDLIETLASQMDPSVVCSVSGLCNSAYIDKLLKEYKDQPQVKKTEGQISLADDEYNPSECSKCYTIAHHIEKQVNQASRDQVLERFLYICGEFSSFSDSCASIVLTHFDALYSHLKQNFKTESICHLSGQCTDKFHVHEDENKPIAVEVRPLSSVGVVDIGDDLPCKLCEQLVGHLRDLLVANTTEEEFKQVLHGLCKQTKSFSTECAAIVDEYYPQIYEFLTKNLNGNAVCQMGGLCPAPGIKTQPIWPMVSQEHAEIALKVMNKNDKVKKTDEVQLPLGRLLVPGFPVIDDTHCATCEFVMNYVKKNGKNYNNKNEIMRVLKEVKDVLPSLGNSNSKKDVSGNSQKDFLNKYEMALAELISEGKDFSEICSLVAVCPSNQQLEAWEQIPSGFTIKSSIKNKPNCPLCLLAIEEMYKYIQNNKTEASIQEALDKLCIKLMPKSLKQECVDLVKVYSKELIQMLLKDMTPEEICEELKFCDPPQNKEHKSYFGDEIIAVPKNDIKGKEACAFCEYVLHYVQEAMTNPKSESEIAEIFKKICKKLPSSVKNDCQLFIEDYSSAMIAILVQEFDPSVVCPMIHLCPTAQLLESYKKTVQVEGTNLQYEDKPNCPLCLFGMSQLDNVIKNNKSKAAIAYAFEKLCSHLPTTLLDQCDSFVKNYSEKIYDMIIADFTPEEVCVYLKLCDPQKNVGPSITFFPLDKDGQIMTNEIPDYPMYQIESETVIIKDQSVKGDTECSICKTVIGFIEKELGTKKSKEDIENALHKVCNELPSQWTEKCNNFVNEYGEILIELITQDITPEQICISFQLCQSETKRLRESVAECALCQSIVSNIENLLSDSKTENLQEIMSNVCEQLPSTEQNKCTMMLEVYERSIVDTYMKYGPRKVCSKLSLCSSLDFLAMVRNNGRTRRQTRDKNLGTKPCTWGKAYWCLDNNTAEECKATEFCKRTGRLTASTSTTIKSSVDDRKVASEAELAVSKDGQVPS